MTAAETTKQQGPISLGEEVLETSRSPWMDAWRRLRRNRAAIMGGIIILLCFLAAIFAPFITSYTYDEQDLLAGNTAPKWVIDVFPKMKAIGVQDGYVRVDNDYFLGTDALGRDLEYSGSCRDQGCEPPGIVGGHRVHSEA
jgi:oligopeptide transport system permease protein